MKENFNCNSTFFCPGAIIKSGFNNNSKVERQEGATLVAGIFLPYESEKISVKSKIRRNHYAHCFIAS